ncbi:hypothetical protein [Streptomyces sp. NPDC014006]|uniref:hypothetical protein n=1 Tax=Streptomyces sp. NPDC014006 TaxID=3364870 RepID=UPI0036FB2DAD
MTVPSQEVVSHLLAHLRAAVWGPTEFVGASPWRLVVGGVVTGCAAAGGIVGLTVAGAWTGRPALAGGEAGLVCAAATALYLVLVRAGRALVGIAALLGVCLALQAPPAAAGVVLAERGRVQFAEVTSVERESGSPKDRGRNLCSVVGADGVRIWRGCKDATHSPETRSPSSTAPKG